MANEKHSADVVITAVYPEFEEPANRKSEYEWKPNIAIKYKKINKRFAPTGEELRAKVNGDKNLWQFDAIGGKNAKGHFFSMNFESGEINGHAWTSWFPVLELFKNGNPRRIMVPDGEEEPEPPEEETPPPPPPKKAAPVQKYAPPPPAKPAPPPLDPNTARVVNFFNELAEEKSNASFCFRKFLDMEGTNACNVLDYAKHMAVMECAGFKVGEGEGTHGYLPDLRAKANESLDYWAGVFHERIKAIKYAGLRDRFLHTVGLCPCKEEIARMIETSWLYLPDSLFQEVRARGRERLEELMGMGGGVKVEGTLQAEIRIRITSAPDEETEDTDPDATAQNPAPPLTKPQLDPAEVHQISETIFKFQDFQKLKTYWLTCRAALQDNEELRDAYRMWVLNKFKASKYTADVVGIRDQVPNWFLTQSLEKELSEIYAGLAQF